ncbi:hypothetical protein HWV62_31337 [Athelia sp. TMB]|nr:hypothetical protein HWV62_31337 [Athelia sp. TMB]
MPADPLFYERFLALMEKSLSDVKTFSERENRPLHEVLLDKDHTTKLFLTKDAAQSILRNASQNLETLHALSGIHSFILAADPISGDAFLGGTVLAREFWRGLRGGGEAGAKGLHAFCLKKTRTPLQGPNESSTPASASVDTKRGSSSSVKAEVYTTVRDALRWVVAYSSLSKAEHA